MSATLPTPDTARPVPPAAGSDPLPALPADVRAFADRHDLGEHLAATVKLLRETGAPPGEVSFSLFVDPESEDEEPWTAVVVAVRIRATVPELLRYDHDAIERWVAVTPAPVRDLIIPRYTFA